MLVIMKGEGPSTAGNVLWSNNRAAVSFFFPLAMSCITSLENNYTEIFRKKWMKVRRGTTRAPHNRVDFYYRCHSHVTQG